MIVMASQRQKDTQELLAEMREWVERLCAVADQIDARAKAEAKRGSGAGTDQGSGGPTPGR